MGPTIRQGPHQGAQKSSRTGRSEEIARERPDVKVGKINVDEQPELAGRFGVMGIPMLVVLRDGKITGQAVGARPKGQILAML